MNVPALFPKTDPGTRAFLALRWRLTPYLAMAEKLPRSGRIADLGCGHGLLALALAKGSPERKVLGVDHDPARVRLAREAARALPNAEFREGSVLALPPEAAGPFDGISLIDVLHYFDPETQEKILRDAWSRLAPGGTLIFREVDPAGGPASGLNKLYERVATWTGFTRTEEEKLFFRTPADWEALLRKTGFTASSARCSHFLFADVLFVGRKA